MADGLTSTEIDEDIGFIFDDLSATGVIETVDVQNAEGESAGSLEILRARQLSREELEGSGFEQEYEFSVYGRTSTISFDIEKGYIFQRTDGTRFRVLDIGKGPGDAYRRFDLGGEWQHE